MKVKTAYFGLIRLFLTTGVVFCALQHTVQAAQFGPGWTLAGNGRNAVIDVPVVFGTKSVPVTNVSDAVTTIWKWDAINQKWAFFSPTMDLVQVATYAASKGYSVLKTIFPGEGYWVNASKSTSVADASAPAFALSPWALTSGWNLVATGSSVTAPQFNTSIAPFAATTVWAWDSVNTNWFFYTPTLDSTQLASYIAQKSYLDFGSQTVSDTTGFWINRAAVTGSPTANLAPIEQAKQLFSQLRTTFHAFANASGTGSLNDQARRVGADLNGVVLPSMQDVLRRAAALNLGTKLFRAVKLGLVTSNSFEYSTVNGYSYDATNSRYYAWKNEYQQFPGYNTPNRSYGYGYVACITNTPLASGSTGVTSVTCSVYGSKYPTYVNSTTTSEQYVNLTITETAADQYAFTAQGRERATVNGVAGTPANIGAGYNGTLSETLDTSGRLQAVVLAGDFPALSQGIDHVKIDLNMARSLKTAGTPYATYRYTTTGSIANTNAAGVSLLGYSLDTGTYFDNFEDSIGNWKANGIQELNLVGVVQTTDTRFNGTVNAKAFTADADAKTYVPTDASFTGSISDISAGGSGAILNVTLTGAVSNYAAYHSAQPSLGSNYIHGALTLNGTVQLPSRPVMALTLSGTATGATTDTLSGQYTYDNGLVITVAATRDSSNPAADTLSFTNQDGIVVTLPDSGNGTITKSGTTLGQISNGMINYTDGYFESLN